MNNLRHAVMRTLGLRESFWILFFAGLVTGCATQPGGPASPMDNPWHHYAQGMEVLEQGDAVRAMSKFDRALELEQNFAPGLAGKALALAMKAKTQTDPGYRKTDAAQSLDTLKRSSKAADSPEEEFIHHLAALRTHTLLQTEDWLDEAEKNYKKASKIKKIDQTKLVYYQTTDAAPYYWGEALYQAQKFRETERVMADVMGLRSGGKWQGPAAKLYKKVQRIVRASAGHTLSGVAGKIAVKESVARADVAALVADELKLEKLFAGRIPNKSAAAARQPEFIPVDIREHPFRNEIETVLKWDVRGLAATYDASSRAWLFNPTSGVTRKELALIFEDALAKLTGDEKLTTAMIGTQRSPFPDVAPEAAWFNAVSTVTSRGLMEPDLSGEFRPEAPADGPELLLGIYKLRNALNIN